MMRIHMPEIVRDGEAACLRATVEYAGSTVHLWYSVAAEWDKYLTTERSDAFVVALLPIAMEAGEDIHVAGTMSERLYYNLLNYYRRILSIVIPSLRSVKIIPEAVDAHPLPRQDTGVATGFSGGIDSFCVLADHLYADVPNSFRVTHLLFNNVGSHGRGVEGRTLCERRFKRLLPAVKAIGLPFIKVDSNLDDLMPQRLGFQLTHTLRNISAALAMQKGISRYLYASGVKYQDCYTGHTYDMAYTDPVAVHMLSTETMECISTGCQYARTEKTARIAELSLTHEFFDVCVHSATGANCSVCWKCARTLLTLEILGKLRLYERVFDLGKYRKIRRAYIGEVLHSKDPLHKEIRELAQERGYRFPWLAHGQHMKNSIISTTGRLWKTVARKCYVTQLYARLRRSVRVSSET